MDRREFLKIFGAGTLATAATLSGCHSPNETSAEGFAPGEVPADKMSYRINSHGEKVSLLGYGCMRLPTVGGNSGREDELDLDQEQINSLADYAIAHGVNLFDTAPPYCKGRSEHAMGLALSRHNRSEYYISTKLSNFSADKWSHEASVEMYRNSFKELQVDYLDYYMLHCVGLSGKDLLGNELDPMKTLEARFLDNGMLDFLIKEREAGRIRNLGFSYHGDVRVFDRLLSMHDKVRWDHVLIQHNYVDWHHDANEQGGDADSNYLYGELERRNIPVFVMEPLLGGNLAKINDNATLQLKQRDPEASVASWAFRFAGSQPRILTVLSGMTYLEHLQDNIRTYSPLKPISDDEYVLLENIAKQLSAFPTVPCTGCQYCMPCPYGLDIPSIFAHYNKCVNEGHVSLSAISDADNSDRKSYLKSRRAFLVGYDRSVPRLRQADHCISCGKCVVHCPQQIKIPQELGRINDYVEKLKSNS